MLDGKSWKKNFGASEVSMNKLTSIAPLPLAKSYVTFLTNSNGGEGPLGVQPYWLILYPAEEVAAIEKEGVFHKFFPNHFVIGGSGGGDAIAFLDDENGATKVVCFDMTNTVLEESVSTIAPSFDELVSMLEDQES